MVAGSSRLCATLNDLIIVQEGIESQAVDRVNRIGQTKPVHVYQLIAENTVEAKVDTDKDKGSATKGIDEPRLGLTLAPANSVAGAGKDGVVVTEVVPKSAAAERGFKEGDVILEVAGKSVTSAGDVREAINAARTDNKNSVLMRVKSGASSRFVAVPLAKG